jgi:hypothetical protein
VNGWKSIGDLAAGHSAYSAFESSPKLTKLFAKLTAQSLGDDASEEVKAKLAKANEALTAAELREQYSISDLDPLSSLTVSKFASGEAAFAAYVQLFSAMSAGSKFSNVPLKSKPVFKESAEKVGKLDFASVSFELDFDKAADGQNVPEEAKEATKALYKQMLGGDKINLWFAKDGNSLVQVSAKDLASAKSIVSLYSTKAEASRSLNGSESYKVTRSGLPSESTMLMLFDTNSLISWGYNMVKGVQKMFPGGEAMQIPEIKFDKNAPKAFVGMSISLKPEHGSVDLFVPSLTVKEVAKIIKPLMNTGD